MRVEKIGQGRIGQLRVAELVFCPRDRTATHTMVVEHDGAAETQRIRDDILHLAPDGDIKRGAHSGLQSLPPNRDPEERHPLRVEVVHLQAGRWMVEVSAVAKARQVDSLQD